MAGDIAVLAHLSLHTTVRIIHDLMEMTRPT